MPQIFMKPYRVTLILFQFLFAACQAPLPVTTTPPDIFMTPPSLSPASTAKADSSLPPLQVITAANAENIQLLKTLEIPGTETESLGQCSVAFSPDGEMLAGACSRNTLPVWDTQSGQLLMTLEPPPIHDVAVVFSPDGKQIAAGGFSNNIGFWDSATGKLVKSIKALPSPIWELAFSPDGKRLASANLDIKFPPISTIPGIHLWEVSNGKLLWDYRQNDARLLILSVDYAPDGKMLAYGTFDSALILDAETGQLRKSLPIPNHVGDLTFSRDGKLLATGSDDRKIRLWKTGAYELQSTLEGHKHYVNGVAFSPNGKLIVSGSHDGKVGVWDVENNKLLKMLAGHDEAVLRIAINSMGTIIASISWDGTVRLWGVINPTQ
jgi:WD40 repeat protein